MILRIRQKGPYMKLGISTLRVSVQPVNILDTSISQVLTPQVTFKNNTGPRWRQTPI